MQHSIVDHLKVPQFCTTLVCLIKSSHSRSNCFVKVVKRIARIDLNRFDEEMFDTASPLGLEASGGLVEHQPKSQTRAPGSIVLGLFICRSFLFAYFSTLIS